jgi:cytochrome c biogenesis protein CcdA/glutaredoxin
LNNLKKEIILRIKKIKKEMVKLKYFSKIFNLVFNFRVLFLVFVLFFFSKSFANIIIYYGQGCPHCERTLALLNEKNISYVKKEVFFNETNRKELLNLYKKFNLNPSLGGVPTILVNSSKKYLIIGELNEKDYKYLIDCPFCKNNSVYFSTPYGLKEYKEDNKKSENNGKIENTKNYSFLHIFFIVIISALIDSINPCVLTIMALLLMNLLNKKGRKETLLAGLIFTFTITFVYFLMGIGLIKAFSFFNQKFIYVFAFFLAIIMFLMKLKSVINYSPGFLSLEMPLFLRPYTKNLIKKANSLFFVFLIALILSLFLVPCSSGPYLIVLAMIASSNLVNKLLGLLLLVIYNLIFALPMLIITFLVAYGLKPEKITEWKEKNIKRINLITLILLLILILFLAYKIYNLF